MFVADQDNYRVRFICNSDSVATAAAISSGITSICPGTAVTFTSSSVNMGFAPAYQWQRNGIPITGATNSSYSSTSLADADIINCIVTSTNPLPCAINGMVASNSITISVLPAAPTPSSIIIANSPVVVSFPGETITYTATYMNGGTSPSFRWYINGIVVPGATTNPFITNTVNNGDRVSVTVFTNSPCAAPDSAYGGNMVTGIASVSANAINIDLYPNPNQGIFSLRGDFKSPQKISIEVVNLLGTVVYKEQTFLVNGLLDKKINLLKLNAGQYFLKIVAKDGSNNYKFAIQ